MRFSLRSLTILTIATVAVSSVFLVGMMSYSFYKMMTDHIISEKVILVQSVNNILKSSFWRYREALNVGSGATRVFLSETAKVPGVVFFRLVEVGSNKVIFSSNSSEEGQIFVFDGLKKIDNFVYEGVFEKEHIVEVMVPGDSGQNLWMGISNKSIQVAATNLVFRGAGIAFLVVIILLFLLYLFNRTALFDVKQYQKQIENALSLINSTLNSITEGILVVDQTGHVTKYNRKFVELWKIPDKVVATNDDKTLLSFVLDQLVDADAFIKRVNELYNKPTESSFEILYFKDGRIFERTSMPQKIGENIVGRVWSFKDVTERKKQEEEIYKKNTQLESWGKDLERMNKSLVGRELKMVALKKEIAQLKELNKE